MTVRSHRRPYLRWIITPALVAVGLAALGACMDDASVVTKPSLSQNASLDPDPSYYEADVRITFSGGSRPNAVRERAYHLVQTYADGFWVTELTNPPPDSPSGGVPGGDIARITLSESGAMAATTSSGRALVVPDLARLNAAMKPDRPLIPQSAVSRAPRIAAALPSPGIGPGPGVERATVNRNAVGIAGRAELLSRFLAPEYTERPGRSGQRRFERTQDGRQFTVDVDAVTGAAIRDEIREGGRLAAVTTREYRQVGSVAVLERELTTQFDAAGAPAGRFERRMTNVRTERSR